MSNRRGYRTFSNSYGQFWFGGNSFPGFLYKRNLGKTNYYAKYLICL